MFNIFPPSCLKCRISFGRGYNEKGLEYKVYAPHVLREGERKMIDKTTGLLVYLSQLITQLKSLIIMRHFKRKLGQFKWNRVSNKYHHILLLLKEINENYK